MKFIRWGSWRIERTGAGILAFITNHGYLDNPTFRGMRQQLMNAFTEIYVLNLHGNSKKKETCPDGSPDENVFDIQQGVTLGIFVKVQGKAGPAKVFHADLWGFRESKYECLFETDLHGTKWAELLPDSPNYLFFPQDTGLAAEYEEGWKVSDLFPRTLLGPNSHRDEFAVAFDKESAISRLKDLASPLLSDDQLAQKYRIPNTRDWRLSEARGLVPKGAAPASCIYRPFDFRYMLYGPFAFDYHRPEINDHLLKSNLALISTRQTKEAFSVLATARPAGQHKLATPYDGSYLSPLYLYPFPEQQRHGQNHLGVETSHWPAGKDGRRPNFNPDFVVDLEKRLVLSFVSDAKGDLKKAFGPEDVFDYLYAVFHSPTYRTRYAEFLKSDFPRVPLTSDLNLFRVLCAKGAELVALHLLESPLLANPIARFPVKGSNQVEKGFPKYVAPGEPEPGTGKALKDGRVYINKAAVAPVSSPATGDETSPLQIGQYFEGVSPEVWNFHIGGYQVCEKWLKDRRGQTLTYEDLEHYCKVVKALSKTIRLMAEIDATLSKWPMT